MRKTHSNFVLYLPEDVVDGVAKESFSVVRRQQLGPQYRHELFKVHLAVPLRHKHTHTHAHTKEKSGMQTRRMAD